MTTLIDTDDAMLWAEEFCRVFDGHTVVDYEPTDEKVRAIGPSRMVSWFANAMQTAIRLHQDRAYVVAHQDENGIITLPEEMPLHVYVSSELLRTMIDHHNSQYEESCMDEADEEEGRFVLPPDRAIRLLRAKAVELEADVLHATDVKVTSDHVKYLSADIGLIANLVAEHMERTEDHIRQLQQMVRHGMDRLNRLEQMQGIMPPTAEELAEARRWRHENFPGISDG